MYISEFIELTLRHSAFLDDSCPQLLEWTQGLRVDSTAMPRNHEVIVCD